MGSISAQVYPTWTLRGNTEITQGLWWRWSSDQRQCTKKSDSPDPCTISHASHFSLGTPWEGHTMGHSQTEAFYYCLYRARCPLTFSHHNCPPHWDSSTVWYLLPWSQMVFSINLVSIQTGMENIRGCIPLFKILWQIQASGIVNQVR